MTNDKLQIKKLYTLSSENKKFSFSLPLKHTIKIGKRNYEVKLKADEKYGTYILWKNRKYPVIPASSTAHQAINMKTMTSPITPKKIKGRRLPNLLDV